MNQPPTICFVALDAYPLLSGRRDLTHLGGGAAVQQALIAGELIRRGLGVSFVTWDRGQPDRVEHGGIRVWKTCGRQEGLPGLRFVHPRWTSLWSALRRADADVYLQRGAGAETGQVALWCRLNHRAFVFAAASDTNCQPELPDLGSRRERLLYRLGLRQASRIIAQSGVQVRAFATNFGLDSELIRSCGGDRAVSRAPRAAGSGVRLLWVGRLAPKKRFELLLDLAAACPQWNFEVAGDSESDGDYARRLIAQARRLANVRLHGRVPHAQIGRMYGHADLLLCTSPVEGFPNTFLEAWARGVPTVSTVDPDGVIAANGLGMVATGVASLRAAVAAITDSPDRWVDCSRRARSYFALHHSPRTAGDAYEKLVHEVLRLEKPPAKEVLA